MERQNPNPNPSQENEVNEENGDVTTPTRTPNTGRPNRNGSDSVRPYWEVRGGSVIRRGRTHTAVFPYIDPRPSRPPRPPPLPPLIRFSEFSHHVLAHPLPLLPLPFDDFRIRKFLRFVHALCYIICPRHHWAQLHLFIRKSSSWDDPWNLMLGKIQLNSLAKRWRLETSSSHNLRFEKGHQEISIKEFLSCDEVWQSVLLGSVS